MISFALRCEPHGHGFDGWFRSGEDFDAQAERRLVECPVCGSTDVAKALMRPALGKGGKASVAGDQAQTAMAPGGGYVNAEAAKVFAKLQEMARELRAKADYVGPRFAEEARRIHYGETEARQIYGEASPAEVKGLGEEGIAALPLPPLPEDKN
ncbi:DUF1178 family protein [Aurantimonas endophytica]|uniref:DUF1178 family protein n=1 Tax=Aurantimonas endophytica TaxID=1522175 RepID=A0A7W6HIB5_9HYPH|nr:hypothetical protein [Aurantimonas endophytica]MCO6406312.1 DUF1178 family protein [Aurantimonas endophytica]